MILNVKWPYLDLLAIRGLFEKPVSYLIVRVELLVVGNRRQPVVKEGIAVVMLFAIQCWLREMFKLKSLKRDQFKPWIDCIFYSIILESMF